VAFVQGFPIRHVGDASTRQITRQVNDWETKGASV